MNNKKYIIPVSIIFFLAIAMAAIYYFDVGGIRNLFITDEGADTMAEIDPSSTTIDSGTNISLDDASAPPLASAPSDSQLKKSIIKKGPAVPSSTLPTVPSDQAPQSFVASTKNNADDNTDSDATQISSSPSEQDPTPNAVSSSSLFSPCQFPITAPSTTQKIILNEIAWMGSPSSSNAEWIEIKNISSDNIDLSGWEVSDFSGKIAVPFSGTDSIPAGGLLLLSRGTANGEKSYSGSLGNDGDVLAIIDPHCNISDYLDASRGWPAGNNTTKQTLERDASSAGWHTSALPGGTPGMENSAGPPAVEYKLTVAFEGDATGTILSNPAGLSCSQSCIGTYASGTTITLTPVAGSNSMFNGWSSNCYGKGNCVLTITANTFLSADFRSTLSPSAIDESPMPPVSSSSDPIIVEDQSSTAPSHSVIVAAIQISGSSSSNDLVKLYNPTNSIIDISGWKLHKKSQTGTDYSLKQFSNGSTIAPGQSFIWANSIGGFSESISANASSTETLSPDNSIALMDASGTIIDAVAWGSGTNQYGEGSPYPTDPGVGQILARRTTDGIFANTENNADDFFLQQ